MILSSRKNQEGYASTPTTYDITFLRIYPNVILPEEKIYVEIKTLAAVIEGTESLYSPTVTYDIGVVDSFNLIEQLKLTGGEKITFGVQQKLKDKTHKYNIECYLSDIISYNKTPTSKATYVLRCVSKQMKSESVTVLSRAFSGTPGNIIKKIVQSDLNTTPHYINETSSKQVQGIFPRLRPLHAIMWLSRNSYDNGTPFYFYDTLKDGLHYKSYKEMLEDDIVDSYNLTRYQAKPSETTEGFEEERLRVREMQSDTYGLARYSDISSGAYASTLHEIDISTKQYKKTIFDSEAQKLMRLNRNPINVYNESTKIKALPLNEHKDAKNYFISKNSKQYNGNNYYSQSDIQLQKAQAQKHLLEQNTLQIQVPGNFDLSAGNKIHLNVYRQKPDADGSGIDKALSGIYLVTEIAHTFEEGYFMDLVIQKDSGELIYDTK